MILYLLYNISLFLAYCETLTLFGCTSQVLQVATPFWAKALPNSGHSPPHSGLSPPHSGLSPSPSTPFFVPKLVPEHSSPGLYLKRDCIKTFSQSFFFFGINILLFSPSLRIETVTFGLVSWVLPLG